MTTLTVVQEEHRSKRDASEVDEYTDSRMIRGNIENVVLGALTGWVVDSESDGVGIPVEVYDRNRLVASGTAEEHRQDLIDAGFVKGAFGFNLEIDPSVLEGEEHVLKLRLPGATEILATKELCAPPFAISRIDEVDAGVVRGTIELNEERENASFEIEILADGDIIASSMCSKAGDESHYGFSVPLPPEISDDNIHIFTARLKNFLTAQEPFQGRLSSIRTPWQYLSDSGSETRLGALSKVAAYRYASLQSSISDISLPCNSSGLAGHLANLKQAHDILVEGYENRKKYPKICLPIFSRPKVSVVVPVHEKFSLTYHCIASLILARNSTSFEVIVVDDKSSDETLEIEKHIENVRVVRNEINLGFLRSSVRGAAQAKGDFIIFLNNDTEVTSGWLDALLDTFSRFDSVGMVGSKLIYPNGKLQEAGGIIWGSGRPWNIGNGKNAEHPMYNYTRQSDYLSGASMIIRRSVWDEVGGFSEELAPAYYEDTDLAFKVREAGYKTMYCPFSTVIHFEGMSNGRNENAGIKRFQSLNAPKFRAKWRHAYRHNGVEGEALSMNMDRGVDFRALVIDYTTPRPDQDAGGYAAIQEILLLQELGCKVTFAPNNMAHMGRHTETLQKNGVECVFAPFYSSVGNFLKQRGRDFDLVYITRYDVAEQVIPSVREFTNAKIIFNNADLHFLRELRAALANGNTPLEGAIKTRERELQVMREVDAVLSYNEVEHSVIASHNLSEENVFKCPWVLKDKRSRTTFQNRDGIAFLGSFNHQPNREAVKHFVSTVMPLLRIARPGIKFHVYGSNVSMDIEKLACDDVVIEGYVESLSDVFDKCRVFVAPLLSGAGIKGKVLESIAYGIPSVLSPIAAEATGLLHRHSTLIANSPEEWSSYIAELYADEEMWKKMADCSHELVNTEYSLEGGLRKMRDVLDFVELEPAESRDRLFRPSSSSALECDRESKCA